jgi:hypothetical protein
MNDEQIRQMIEELVKDIDYYIYKEMFVYNDLDDNVDGLVKIVRKHMNIQ